MFGLETIAPKFLVPSKRIKVLYEPSEFYSYLRAQILNAQSRVFLASLYLGRSEQELIDVLAEALRKNDKLQVHVLVDALRGTREAPKACSASLLAPLAEQFPSRVRLTMYQTPKLGKVMAAVLPKRIIEGVGLQHMKLYGFDNEIVLSGANLSTDYFTNRQDRYISIKDEQVTNWFFKVHCAVSDMSHRLLPAKNEQGFTLTAQPRSARKVAKAQLAELLRPGSRTDQTSMAGSGNRIVEVYPVGQFTPLGLGNEHAALERVMKAASSPDYSWLLTAGYFNLAPSLAKNLVAAGDGEIIVASAKANGFYNSKGISGRLPHFYSILLRRFLEQVERNKDDLGATSMSRQTQSASSDLQASAGRLGSQNPPDPSQNPLGRGGDERRAAPAASIPPHPGRQLSLTLGASEVPDPAGSSPLGASFPTPGPLEVREWERGTVNTPGGWSYHAKGIWLANQKGQGQHSASAGNAPTRTRGSPADPFLTYIGSSNFTRRSYLHDIEVGALLVTTGSDSPDLLGDQLRAECEHLRQHCGSLETLQSVNPKVTLSDRVLLYLFGDRL